jgi:predicted nucleic acid-binding protein
VAALYLDTSVLGRILLGEPDATVALRTLGDFEQHVSSRLLPVELRRLGLRYDCLADADQLLAGVALLPLEETTLRTAETLAPPGVATLDAIHLASALRVADAELLGALMTYDTRLAAGAAAHGLPVVAPA